MTKVSNETKASVRSLHLCNHLHASDINASIGGMSAWSMRLDLSNWKIAYPLFLLGLGIIALINYYLIRKLERTADEENYQYGYSFIPCGSLIRSQTF